jgi:hypothetical protein
MNKIALTSDNLLPIETENRIATVVKQLNELKEAEKVLKESLLIEMQKRNIKKIDTPKLTITYVDETTKEDFDKKAFKEAHKDLYDEYAKISPVKAYVKIGVKNED